MKNLVSCLVLVALVLTGSWSAGKKESARVANLKEGFHVAGRARFIIERMRQTLRAFARQQRADFRQLKRLSNQFSNFSQIKVGGRTYDTGEVVKIVDLAKFDWEINVRERMADESRSQMNWIMEEFAQTIKEWQGGLKKLQKNRP